MKKNYLIILLSYMALTGYAQNPDFEWAKQIEGFGNDEAYSITTDLSGNVYTTGSFSGTADFDPGSGVQNLSAAGNKDTFIQKLDIDGNFVWAKRIGDSNNEAAYSIITDLSENLYIIGSFAGTVDFDPSAGVQNLTALGLTGNVDIFILKLDSNGNFLWVKQTGGSTSDFGVSITLDANSNLYTTGYFQGTVDFDPGAGVQNLTSNGLTDIFIQKLDANGNFLWAKHMGGGLQDQGLSIITDNNGNVYTTGSFRATVDFDPGAGIQNLTSIGHYDVFIQKLDADGNFQWAKHMGRFGEYQAGKSIATDDSGNVYTTGYFEGTVDFDPGAGVLNLSSNSGSRDVFIQKLDTNGDFVWAKGIGAFSSDTGHSIITDSNGNVYTTGAFNRTVDFDPGSGVQNFTTNGYTDVFILKLDNNGDFVWVQQMGGANTDLGRSSTIDAGGNIYTTGSFKLTADFDPSSDVQNFTSLADSDIFIQKLSDVPTCVLDLTLTTPNNNYQMGDQVQIVTGNSITANNTIGAGAIIIYDTGSIISLTNGFSVEAGSDFEAIIGGCSP